MIPTIDEVMKNYPVIAGCERMKTGQPNETSVRNVLHGVRHLCSAAEVKLTDRIDVLTRQRMDMALTALISRGLKRISAKTYRDDVRALFARWCKPYYESLGWEIPGVDLPFMRIGQARYVRPSSEKLAKVKTWYNGLDGEWWLAATMMLEFAMRNGDVLRLKDENFILRKEEGADGSRCESHFLSYTPHKTEQSSGRKVCWQIPDSIWQRFSECGGMAGFDITEETFDDINHDLRSIGFTGSKASYELRKICIDHIYQKFGAEVAVAISGDDIRTISRYYADPSLPAAGNRVRVIDLL